MGKTVFQYGTNYLYQKEVEDKTAKREELNRLIEEYHKQGKAIKVIPPAALPEPDPTPTQEFIQQSEQLQAKIISRRRPATI